MLDIIVGGVPTAFFSKKGEQHANNCAIGKMPFHRLTIFVTFRLALRQSA
jgi:hypothetical protein